MKLEKQKPTGTQKRAKFDAAHLVANSTIASVGAGAAMVASTGMIWPAVAAAAVGAYVGYSATNEIPKNGD